MDPFGAVALCLLVAFLLVKTRKSKGKPFLAWVLPVPTKKKRKSRGRR